MKNNQHKQFPGKMDHANKRKYKLSFKMGYGKLKHVKLFESFDQVKNFSDAEIESIKEVIKKTPMMSLAKPLEGLGFVVQTNTYDMPMPPVIIEVRKNKGDKQKVVIVNRKYTDDPDFVHGEVAMGIMERAIVNEARQSAPAVGKKNQRISKKFKKKVDDMIGLAKQFVTISEEYKAMSKLLGKYEKEVQEELEKYGAQFIRIGNVSIELKTITGKKTKSYKEISDALEAMLPVSKEMEKAIKNVMDLHTKINPDKVKMLYSVQENAVTDFVKKLGAWFTNIWKKIKGHVTEFTTSVDDLADKLKPLGIKVPTTEAAIKTMEKK